MTKEKPKKKEIPEFVGWEADVTRIKGYNQAIDDYEAYERANSVSEEEIAEVLSEHIYQEKGKAKTLSRVISCNDLGLGVAKMYQMLHQQWATKRRMYNVSGGAAVVLHISEEFNVPFELGGNFQRLTMNSFSPLELFDALLGRLHILTSVEEINEEMCAAYESLKDERAKYLATMRKKAVGSILVEDDSAV